MSQSTITAAMCSLMLGVALAPAHARAADVSGSAANAPDAHASNAPDSTASDDTSRVTGANDIYRVKIVSIPSVPSIADSSRFRIPIEVYGKAGYYLYDNDAWDMVSSDPFIDVLRGRPYSLYGSDLDVGALNRWTMRSEHIRHDDFAGSDANPRPSWSYPGWRFW